MREIKLELVRHGPPHNQLLSPLTSYLALCQNHPPVTVHVPFEHEQLLYRLKSLNYKGDASAREFELVDMGRAMGALLGQIPGLIAELGKESEDGIQLRLILSSSELALLPFELAFASEGMPGAGQQLLLQSEAPLCLTREVRRSGSGRNAYNGEETGGNANILFAWAAPKDYDAVPHEAHLLALIKVVDPWTDWELEKSSKHPNITVLPQASLQDIEAACRTTCFTHVHILAHGNLQSTGLGREYGLALHGERSNIRQADIVLGDRLASALSPSNDSSAKIYKPVAVTICSCYGGAKGTVTNAAGSSVAHALHIAGVPLVLASQFPFSHAASVRMVEIVYESLMWGKDPRLAVTNLRRSLQAELPKTHDWAAVSAYMEFDPTFDAMQPYRQSAAINHQVRKLEDSSIEKDQNLKARKEKLENLSLQIRNLIDTHFAPIKREVGNERKPLWEQQAGQLLWSWGRLKEADMALQSESPDDEEEFINTLREELPVIRSRYWAAVTYDRTDPTSMICYLWLDLLCELALTADVDVAKQDNQAGVKTERESDRNPADLWASAHVTALYNKDLPNLIELHLVWHALSLKPTTGKTGLAERYAREFVRDDDDAQFRARLAGRIKRRTVWAGLLCKQPNKLLHSRLRELVEEVNKALVILRQPRISDFDQLEVVPTQTQTESQT